ncbi:MAG: hypothetical protein DRQ24_10475 [Candidatus Latescibacterota bacterium]|nr:MAG: hypothetical protein DRQ24_10475 [Candidatus Latescibacterota bacterium]
MFVCTLHCNSRLLKNTNIIDIFTIIMVKSEKLFFIELKVLSIIVFLSIYSDKSSILLDKIVNIALNY